MLNWFQHPHYVSFAFGRRTLSLLCGGLNSDGKQVGGIVPGQLKIQSLRIRSNFLRKAVSSEVKKEGEILFFNFSNPP